MMPISRRFLLLRQLERTFLKLPSYPKKQSESIELAYIVIQNLLTELTENIHTIRDRLHFTHFNDRNDLLISGAKIRIEHFGPK